MDVFIIRMHYAETARLNLSTTSRLPSLFLGIFVQALICACEIHHCLLVPYNLSAYLDFLNAELSHCQGIIE